MNGAGKITAPHRGRLALVYVRQSSPVQVREHAESTGRQYGLAETAIELGWAPGGVVVVDADLGISGRFGPLLGGADPADGTRPADRHARDRAHDAP